MLKLHSPSLRTRIRAVCAVAALLSIGVVGVTAFLGRQELVAENTRLAGRNVGIQLKHDLDGILADNARLSVPTINLILKAAGSRGIRDLTLFGDNGKVYVDVRANRTTGRQDATVEDLHLIADALSRRDAGDGLLCNPSGDVRGSVDLYIPFTYDTSNSGVAQVRVAVPGINRIMVRVYQQCGIVVLALIAIHFLLAWLLSGVFLAPLRKLVEATRGVAQGTLNIRVSIVRDDEIGRLASSFNEMSVALQHARDDAKDSNPLSGLPGGIATSRYIDDALSRGKVIAVLFCDLDNIKAYNDRYGFSKGDEAILYARDCLAAAAKRTDTKDLFVGHEGGDDFVVVCEHDSWEPFAKSVITTFDRGIYQFYGSVDARNGYIESLDRRGQPRRFPLMSISISVVTNKTRPFRRHAEMAQVAAEVKKCVKSIAGSCYSLDRRQGPVGAAEPPAPGASTAGEPPAASPPPSA